MQVAQITCTTRRRAYARAKRCARKGKAVREYVASRGRFGLQAVVRSEDASQSHTAHGRFRK
eukprot:3640552-Pleurochrysis_carterae.AAC.1